MARRVAGEATKEDPSMSPTERVSLSVEFKCVSCTRMLARTATLDGDAVRTGNTTQKASYWLDQMQRELTSEAKQRGWQVFEGTRGHGVYCAHCIAAERDPLSLTKIRENVEDSP